MTFVLWFTGLPCSGKTTISKHLLGKIPNLEVLDGDELVSSKYDDETVTRVTGFMTIGDLKKKIKDFAKTKKESVRVINGKKYKAVKESKNHPLKQIYDRTFRSLK